MMNIDISQIVVPICNNTRNPRININHDRHRNEERAHCGENNVALILIVTTLSQISPSWLVPTKLQTNKM